MLNQPNILPRKTRELQNHHMDSTVWDDFQFRDGDVVVATYGKSGTTWTQQIVGQILLGPDPDLPTAQLSPWVDRGCHRARSSCPNLRRSPTAASSRLICRSMLCAFRTRQNLSSSAVTGAM